MLLLHCRNKNLETDRELKYLSSLINYDGKMMTKINRRIDQLTRAFNRLKPIWRSGKYFLRLRIHLFSSNVLSILLYASECWKMNQQLEKRILAFENMCLRRILNMSWQQRVSNSEIRNRTGQALITAVSRKKG